MHLNPFMQALFSRILSVLLTITLCMSWFPHPAFATEAPLKVPSTIETSVTDINSEPQHPIQIQPEPKILSVTEDEQAASPFPSQSSIPAQESSSDQTFPNSGENESSAEKLESVQLTNPEAGKEISSAFPDVEAQLESSETEYSDSGTDPDEFFEFPVQIGSNPNAVIAPSVLEPKSELTQSNAISPFSLDATPSKNNNNANFYIYLDGSWTCIGTLEFTVSSSTFTYTPSLTTSEIVDLINENISEAYTLSSSDFKLYHASNSNFSNNTGFSSISSSSTTLGSYRFNSNTAKAAKYVRVMSTNSSTNNLTPLNFYTVTLDYPDQADESFIVPTGSFVTLPAGYTWTANGSSYDENEIVTITDTTTFVGSVAIPVETFTVTCINGETTTTDTVNSGSMFTLPMLSAGYHWFCDDVSYSGGEDVVIDRDMTFTATAISYTVTCNFGDSITTSTVNYGDTFTLPMLSTGYYWTSGNISYFGGENVVIQGDITFTAAIIICTVTCINGSSTTNSTVTYGGIFILPVLDSSTYWFSNGVSYSGGESVTITGNTTFTAVTSTILVNYDVNFPTGSTGFFGTSFPASPTLVGTDSSTIATDTVNMNQPFGIRDISSRTVATTSSSHNAKFQMAIFFTGWETESGDIIQPNTILSWSNLLSYDADGDEIVELEGRWSYGSGNVVNFCVRYDSKTGQSDTSTSRYTPSLFTTYVGGSGSLSLDSATDEAAYQVDQQIRALYGNWGGDLWLSTFPSDEYIFEQLKSYTSILTVGDKSVSPEDLTAEKYAIRWYMIKEDSGDGWHIDGRLFEKVGQITVDKEFYGDQATLEQAQKGFYVVAVTGSEDINGDFVAYTSTDSGFKQYILVLDNATSNSLSSSYPNATFILYDSNESNPDNYAYEWLIGDVMKDELWQFTEYPVNVDGCKCYTEYSVYDTDGETTALAEFGTSAFLVGKTFFLDQDPDQGMLVDFRNYYYSTDSIFVKTEDGDTGLPLPGAGYELWQAAPDGGFEQLTFRYDTDTDQYVYNPAGTVTQITSSSAGYAIISTSGFSYSFGDVMIKEIIAPFGYSAAPNITISSDGSNISISDLTFEDGATIPAAQWTRHAELEENGEVLVVKNYSADPTSVTVKKVWADSVTAQNVTVVLQANGSIASNAFPGMTGVQVTLSTANSWSYTWENLPSYANGAQVEWSVKETKIGEETTLADGVTYANWTVVYSPAEKTDSDNDGVPENWSFTVTNTVRRTQLFLTKTDSSRSVPLANAKFTLVAVEWSDSKWTQIPGATVHSGTSDAHGLIHFDALVAGAHYMLTETAAPSGFSIGQESIVLTLDSSGQVFQAKNGVADSTVLAAEYHTYTSAYNICVTNITQYSCSISAPDVLAFTYEAGSYIWNPEIMKYEQSAGRWTSNNTPISLTNTTVIDSSITVEAVFTFESGSFSLIDYVALDASVPFSVTQTDAAITLTSTLAAGERMYIYLTLDGAPPASSGSVNIGSLSIRVHSPRRRFLQRMLRISLP